MDFLKLTRRVLDDNGLQDIGLTPFYKQVTRAGRPGMAVAAVSSLDPSVTAIAFSANGTDHPDAFVLINLASAAKMAEIAVRGARSLTFSAWRTSEEEHYRRIPDMQLVEGKLNEPWDGRVWPTFRCEGLPLRIRTGPGEAVEYALFRLQPVALRL